MGLIFSHAAFLLEAKKAGARFDEILTIGRQRLYLTENQTQILAKRAGRTITPSLSARDQYAEDFFKAVLDARRILSLDYSRYENCDIIHDMNQPIDPDLYEKFDVVIDGGSLEHIFHFPVAISNCMKMVKKGGSVFIFTTANNFLGHGFYQFSPELFFRTFEARNGFEIRNVILEKHRFPGVELTSRTDMYLVNDPALLGERVGLVSKSPVLIMVHAVRTEETPIFENYPVQSDYASLYMMVRCPTKNPLLKAFAAKALQYLPLRFRNYIIGKYQLMRYSFSNKRFYKKWSPF